MARATRVGRRSIVVGASIAGMAVTILALATAANADLGFAVMTLGAPTHPNAVYGDKVIFGGSISDHSRSCTIAHDCDQPVGTVTLTVDSATVYSTPTTPGDIEPYAEFRFEPPRLAAGFHHLEATFAGNFTVLVPSYQDFRLRERPCATTLTQSIAATEENGAVTLTAKVSTSTAPATGTVVFYQDDGTPALDLVLATATVDPATNTATSIDVGALLPPGATTMYAEYSGDANHEDDCQSNDVIHTVADDPPPTAADDSVAAQRNTAITFDVLANDADPAGQPLSGPEVIGLGPAHGELVLSGTALTYTPDADFVGDDSFTYYVTDSNGTQSAPATVAINVACDSDAVNDTYTTAFETTLVISDVNANVLTNDDPCERAIELLDSPGHGAVFGFDGFNGLFSYTPDADYFGLDSFTYAYSAGTQLIDIGRVFVVVQAEPGTPVSDPTSTTTSSTVTATSSPTDTAGTTTTAATEATSTSATVLPTETSVGGDLAVPGGATLPETGRDVGRMGQIAAAFIVIGVALIVRRRGCAT